MVVCKPRKLQLEALESRALFSINVTGIHHEQITINNPGDGAIIDLTGGTFLALEDTQFYQGQPLPAEWPARDTHLEYESVNAERYPLNIRGTSANIVINGGTVVGRMDDRAPWHVWKQYSDGTGLRIEGSVGYEIKNIFIKNTEDGIDPRGSAGAYFNIHDVYLTDIHDDMVENDDMHSGTIHDSYMRGHTFLSARGDPTELNPVVLVEDMVVELILQPDMGDHGPDDINHEGGYPYPDGLGSGTLFKWEDDSGTVDVRDSIFLVPRYSSSSMNAMKFPPGVWSNVTIVWLGDGPYPWPAPPGVTITTDRTPFDNAVAAFFASHPQFTPQESSIAGRQIFYNQSKFDGNDAAITAADDAAIASDKLAYIAGDGAATAANMTSYTKGINGIMVDFSREHGPITASDFIFKVGNNNAPGAWSNAPAPTTVSLRAGAGVGGSDRVEIVWADGAIAKKWLQVIVKGNDPLGEFNLNTGLGASDLFYWGNALANSFTGDSATAALTNATDEIAARSNPLFAGATVSNPYDYDRSGGVNATDQLAARNNGNIAANAPRFLNMSYDVLAPEATEEAVEPLVMLMGETDKTVPVTSLGAGSALAASNPADTARRLDRDAALVRHFWRDGARRLQKTSGIGDDVFAPDADWLAALASRRPGKNR